MWQDHRGNPQDIGLPLSTRTAETLNFAFRCLDAKREHLFLDITCVRSHVKLNLRISHIAHTLFIRYSILLIINHPRQHGEWKLPFRRRHKRRSGKCHQTS